MQETNRDLVERIMATPLLQAEWVLWLLIALSVLSLSIIVDRLTFLLRHRVDLADVRQRLIDALRGERLAELVVELAKKDALETNVLREALRAAFEGPDAVEEVARATLSEQRQRYERALTLLAIVGSNAPFIGLFGTVLGIIRAFASLSASSADASRAVMAGVSEALVATAIGLLVAIPAVAAFNFIKARVRLRTEHADQLVRTLLARLKSGEPMTRLVETTLAA